MAYPILVEPEAQLDIREGFTWYESGPAGFGGEFIAELERTFVQVSEFPESRAVETDHASLRCCDDFHTWYAICLRTTQSTLYLYSMVTAILVPGSSVFPDRYVEGGNTNLPERRSVVFLESRSVAGAR